MVHVDICRCYCQSVLCRSVRNPSDSPDTTEFFWVENAALDGNCTVSICEGIQSRLMLGATAASSRHKRQKTKLHNCPSRRLEPLIYESPSTFPGHPWSLYTVLPESWSIRTLFHRGEIKKLRGRRKRIGLCAILGVIDLAVAVSRKFCRRAYCCFKFWDPSQKRHNGSIRTCCRVLRFSVIHVRFCSIMRISSSTARISTYKLCRGHANHDCNSHNGTQRHQSNDIDEVYDQSSDG